MENDRHSSLLNEENQPSLKVSEVETKEGVLRISLKTKQKKNNTYNRRCNHGKFEKDLIFISYCVVKGHTHTDRQTDRETYTHRVGGRKGI